MTIRLKVNGASIPAEPTIEEPEGHRYTLHFITPEPFGPLSETIQATGSEQIVDGPNREFQVVLDGASSHHGESHWVGGTDPITLPLAVTAYPTPQGPFASRPASTEENQLYFANDKALLYIDTSTFGWMLASAVIVVGTIGSRPAFGTADRLYWSTDEHILYRDTGAAWVKLAVADYADLDGIPSTFAPASHLLADNTGLGSAHTISGAAANQCLRASSSSAAAFSTGDLDNNARVEVSQNTTPFAKRREIDFTDVPELTWSLTDSGVNERVSITPILYRQFIPLTSDVASTASTAFQNITGLSFSMTSGVNYRVYAMLLYTASANTIGLRVSYTGPAMTHQVYHTRVMPPGTTGGVPAAGTDNFWDQVQIAADTGTTSQASVSTSTGNLLIFEGIFRPSAGGTFQLRFAPETATASGIVIEAGSSLEWW